MSDLFEKQRIVRLKDVKRNLKEAADYIDWLDEKRKKDITALQNAVDEAQAKYDRLNKAVCLALIGELDTATMNKVLGHILRLRDSDVELVCDVQKYTLPVQKAVLGVFVNGK